MEIILNRVGGVPLRDQLVTQIELRILSGALKPGQKLPSVRALARRLKLHPNTVSAAYQDLQAAGHARTRRRSGVFVLSAGPSTLEEARSLDEMIRMALGIAFRRGFNAAQIRAAVTRWMAAVPPDRIVFVDPVPDARDLFVAELKAMVSLPVSGCSPEEVERDPARMTGALGVCLPYHLEPLRSLVPGAPFEAIHLELPESERQAILGLPAGAVVLVVSHASTVLPFATVLGRSLRGDEILVETRLLSDRRGWQRLLPAVDLVLADVLAFPALGRARPKRIHEMRLLSASVIEHLREALEFVVPIPAED